MFFLVFVYLVFAFGTAKYVYQDSLDKDNRSRVLTAIAWGVFWFVTIPGSFIAEVFDWLQNG